MPHTRIVKTLKQTCLRNISRNMDRFWTTDFDRNLADLPRLFYVLGPFDYLTPDMIQELLNNLTVDRKLRRTHIHLLLTSHLDHLDFSQCASMTSMLHLVGIRCQKLVKLDLSNCVTATPTVLCSLFPNLPHLKWLNLRLTKANDQVLSSIFTSCNKLQHLDVFACQLTDRGILRICETLQFENSSNNNHLKNITVDKSLLYLDISVTKIGSKGAVAILQTFSNLHVLQYADIIDAVAQISNSKSIEPTKLKLRTLTTTGIKCKNSSPEHVQAACLACPNVTEVYLYQNAHDESIQCLKELKHLQTLEITSDQWGDVTFFDGLKPLLSVVGQNIHSLGLYDIKDLDIGQLGVLCPNLNKLKCVMAAFNSVAFVETPLQGRDLRTIYSHLNNLMVVLGNDGTNFSAEMFEQILLNAEGLSEIHLINVQCFSTEMLLRVLHHHGMKNITSFTLESGDKITAKAIHSLLSLNSPLKSICLRNCHEVTRKDFESFKKIVRKKNLDVTITWE